MPLLHPPPLLLGTHLPPEAILLVDHLQDVSPSEQHSGFLRGNETVRLGIVVKVRSEIELCDASRLMVAGFYLDDQGPRAVFLRDGGEGRGERERDKKVLIST